MPLPVINGVVRAAQSGVTSNGTPWVNVYHCRLNAGGTPTVAQLNTLDALFDNLIFSTTYTGGGPLLNYCGNGLSWTLSSYLPLDGTSATSTRVHARAGLGGAGDVLPAQSSAVVKLRTGLRGRSHRGRLFLPPWVEAHNDLGGHIPTADRTAVLNQFIGWQTALTAGGWTHVVASYLAPGSYAPVTEYDMDIYFKVQRRRRV